MGAKNRPLFQKGYKKSAVICGFGINDADYAIMRKVDGKKEFCPIYKAWSDMIHRTMGKSQTYAYMDKSVSSEWKYFSSFRKWALENSYTTGLQLDKDILVKGNKIYGPETCALVPGYVNSCIKGFERFQGEYPIGVHWSSHLKGRPFESMCKIGDKRKRLGRFATPMEAHAAWQLGKAEALEIAIARYAKEACFNTKVAEALMCRVWDLRLDNVKGIETKSL